jgi:ATP-dependent Clp protease ATP-binding subunit ClpA
VVAQWTGIPMQKLSVDDSSLLMGLEGQLSERVIGQQEATKAITKAVSATKAVLQSVTKPMLLRVTKCYQPTLARCTLVLFANG